MGIFDKNKEKDKSIDNDGIKKLVHELVAKELDNIKNGISNAVEDKFKEIDKQVSDAVEIAKNKALSQSGQPEDGGSVSANPSYDDFLK